MDGISNIVTTNQDGIHPDLEKIVLKHMTHMWRGPIHPATQNAFDSVSSTLQSLKEQRKPWILDSGCGVGESTLKLAQLYPGHFILGVDRSEIRLDKASVKLQKPTIIDPNTRNMKNFLFIRAELGDFWRLLLKNDLYPAQHYILYPNPYPKKMHIKKRFHGDPSLREILLLCPHLELRSNWKLYLSEFQFAVNNGSKILGLESFRDGTLSQLNPTPESAWTLFEKKFSASGQDIHSLRFNS
jgi:tRNA G46 methylase TrmB